MVRTSVRMSELIGGRPGVFGCESLHQYRLSRFRCHEITVSGLTITSADFPLLPDRPQPDPKQSVSAMQSWSPHVAFENSQLLTKCGVFQGDLFLTTEHQNNESNHNHYLFQHVEMTLPLGDARINCLLAYAVLAKDTGISWKSSVHVRVLREHDTFVEICER